ncbi:LOW QUALITY PROTEIN: hypothetical protein HID58_087226 [Brassica napus]|uniref:Uncharacterized protein n=1 Tax=Brassica napus TaxID=3708 RepID=A0ABQ7XSN5_BRANA|nr:LOW QUALITY PROTEIN: hypothetical protein HID58_087226 [Brassica napus]
MGGLGAMNEALMASNLEARTFRLRPKEAKKEAARLKNEVEARKAEFESVHAEGMREAASIYEDHLIQIVGGDGYCSRSLLGDVGALEYMRETEAFNYDTKLALVPIHVSPDCEDIAPAAPHEERRLTSLRIRSTLVIMGLDIHAPVFIISPNDRFCI